MKERGERRASLTLAFAPSSEHGSATEFAALFGRQKRHPLRSALGAAGLTAETSESDRRRVLTLRALRHRPELSHIDATFTQSYHTKTASCIAHCITTTSRTRRRS